MGIPKNKIFISYSRKDSEIIIRISNSLKNNEIDIWIDTEDLEHGDYWDATIQNTIKNIDILIVVLTPNSSCSNNVMNEVSYAIQLGKKVIPIMASVCEIPLLINRVNYIDFTKNYEGGITQLVEAINGPLNKRVNNPPTKNINQSNKLKFPQIKYGSILLLAGCLIFPAKWLFEFKGIIYEQPKVINDSTIHVNLHTTIPYKNLGVSLLLTNKNFNHSINEVAFNKDLYDHSFKEDSEDCETQDTMERTVMQPVVDIGKYAIEFPYRKKKRDNLLTEKDFVVSYNVLDKNRQKQLISINNKNKSWSDSLFFHPILFITCILLAGMVVYLLFHLKKTTS